MSDLPARAAVDIGSNSVRLLVCDAAGGRLVRHMRVTRLAAGVDRAGHLDDDAIARTLAVLSEFRDEWRAHGVPCDCVRIAATSAVRDSADRERFVAAVRESVGVETTVLTGEQEAALAFAGAVAGIGVSAGPAAVVDVGGGSTEVVLGEGDGRVVASVSMQLGCVRITERHLADDPPTSVQLAAARADVTRTLAALEETFDSAGAVPLGDRPLIAVAGTATTIAAVHLGLPRYEEERIHGTRLPLAALEEIAERLVRMDADQRRALGPMQPGRAEVIHGGGLVLAAVARRLGAEEVIVSESDGLDGLAETIA